MLIEMFLLGGLLRAVGAVVLWVGGWVPSGQVLGPNDRAQATMVAAWLTELLLDQHRPRPAGAAAGQHSPAYEQHVQQLR